MDVKVKKLTLDAILPTHAHSDDAGYDLYSRESVTLEPHQQYVFSLGFAVEFPTGYVALVWGRSSMAGKNGVDTTAGVIDSGYRGEWKIVLHNISTKPVQVQKGDRIAQVLFQKVEYPTLREVSELSQTERGHGGFGSTNKTQSINA